MMVFLISNTAYAQGLYQDNTFSQDELLLSDVTEEVIEIQWWNRNTLSATKTIHDFLTKHGKVVLEVNRTSNMEKCGVKAYCNLPKDESADTVTVLSTPDGWVSEKGREISLHEGSIYVIRIIRWVGM